MTTSASLARCSAALFTLLLLGAGPLAAQEPSSGEPESTSFESSDSLLLGQMDASGLPMLAATSSGGPQRLALPSLGEMMGSLKENAMGMVEGCDYAKYMKMADQFANSSSLLKGLTDGVPRDFAMPVLDPMNLFTRVFGTAATREAAKAETNSLVYMLESTCNAVRQADETNRQLEIVKAGRVNIGNAVSWLADNLQVKLFPENTDVQTQERKAKVSADFGEMYEQLHISRVEGNDTAWVMLTNRLHQTLKLADEYDKALNDLEKQLTKTRKDLFLPAERDSTNRWVCPEGYPDLNNLSPEQHPKDHDGNTVCGAATPERSTQVLAHLTFLNSHIRALEINIMSQTMQVEAIRLAVENQQRKEEERARFDGQAHF